MKFLLPLFLFFAIAFATTNYRLKVHRVDVADTAAEYVAIKGKDAVLSSTPQSTIAIVFLDPEPVGYLRNDTGTGTTTPAYLLPTETKDLYYFNFGSIPTTPGALYQNWTIMGSSDYNYLAYNSSKEEPARYESFFILDKDNKFKFAKNYEVPTQSSAMIKLEMDPVISASPSSETV